MKTTVKHEWANLFQFYTQMYKGQPTRLGFFENENGTVIDYWIEDGLPLTGIDIDTVNSGACVEIVLGDLTHTVKDPAKITAYFSIDGAENGLDILDRAGTTTILRFENFERA
jgi:hypothetical protein